VGNAVVHSETPRPHKRGVTQARPTGDETRPAKKKGIHEEGPTENGVMISVKSSSGGGSRRLQTKKLTSVDRWNEGRGDIAECFVWMCARGIQMSRGAAAQK